MKKSLIAIALTTLSFNAFAAETVLFDEKTLQPIYISETNPNFIQYRQCMDDYSKQEKRFDYKDESFTIAQREQAVSKALDCAKSFGKFLDKNHTDMTSFLNYWDFNTKKTPTSKSQTGINFEKNTKRLYEVINSTCNIYKDNAYIYTFATITEVKDEKSGESDFVPSKGWENLGKKYGDLKTEVCKNTFKIDHLKVATEAAWEIKKRP